MKYIIIILVYLYYFTIRKIISFFIHLIWINKYKKNKKQYEKEIYKLLSINNIIEFAKELNHKYKYKYDPLLGALDEWLNKKTLWLFEARGGNDCDGWATLYYYWAKLHKKYPKMYIIFDYPFKYPHVFATINDKILCNYIVSYYNNKQQMLEQINAVMGDIYKKPIAIRVK